MGPKGIWACFGGVVMGNRGRKTFSRTVQMLNFDVRPSIVIGFALHWCWVWMVFWSTKFYSAASEYDADKGLEWLWNISLAAMVCTLLALFFVSRKKGVLGRSAALVTSAGVMTAVGTLLVIDPTLFASRQVALGVYAVGAILTGVGSAIELVIWGELLIVLGTRQTVVYFTSATILSAIIFLFLSPIGSSYSELIVVRILTALMPLGEIALLLRQSGLFKDSGKRAPIAEGHEIANGSARNEPSDGIALWDAHQHRPTKLGRALLSLFGIALVFGMSYGMMKGLFVTSGEADIVVRNVINAVALIFGCVAIFLMMSQLRMDLGRLTYQIALPLMALGFLLFALDRPMNLLGFGVHQFGYQYFYTIIWAYWSVLSHRLGGPYAQYAATGAFGVQFGQITGSMVGAAIAHAVTSPYQLAMTSASAILVILFISVFQMSATPLSSIAPFGQGPVRTRFYSACTNLADARGFSPRERDVFMILVRGRNCAYIANELHIAESTVKSHIKSIYRKAGVHSQQELLDAIDFEGRADASK